MRRNFFRVSTISGAHQPIDADLVEPDEAAGD